MGIVTITSCSVAAIVAGSAYLLRRRISRDWIDLRSTPFDLSGKVVVITGGNVGLGFEAAQDFARRNGTVVLGCRSISKGQEALTQIKKSTHNGNLECLELDLASLESVRHFASAVKAKYPSVHALVLNAGVWVPMEEQRKTKDGFEVHFGVNHLAHFLLAQSLMDHLSKTGDSRIIFVSSGLLKSGKINLEKLDFVHDGRVKDDDEESSTGGGKRQQKDKSFAPLGYCDSKLMNALACKHLSTILPSHVSTYAVCPGFCRSHLGRHVSFPLHKKILFAPIMLMIQRRTVQGAQNIIYATVEDKGRLESGCFYRDGQIAKDETAYVQSLGDEFPEKLWKFSEKLVEQSGDEVRREAPVDQKS